MLRAQQPTATLIREAAATVVELTDPPDDIHASAEYRREMSAVFTRRALTAALARLDIRV